MKINRRQWKKLEYLDSVKRKEWIEKFNNCRTLNNSLQLERELDLIVERIKYEETQIEYERANNWVENQIGKSEKEFDE